MITEQTQDKLKELLTQQAGLDKAIKDLKHEMTKPHVEEPWITSKGTVEGREARNEYFGEGESPFMVTSQAFGYPRLLFYPENYDLEQAPPQIGFWYWRKGYEDIPEDGSYCVCLRKDGRMFMDALSCASDLSSSWNYKADNLIIAYMLLK